MPLPMHEVAGAISDAIAELGSPEEIRRLLAEFQQFLYREAA